MIPAVLVFLVLAMPVQAQRSGCGMGAGLEALRAAERPLREGMGAGSLSAGRDLGGVAADRLTEAAVRLEGCGCRQVAEHLREAAGLAEEVRAEASLERLRRVLDRAAFSAGLARERLDRRGCS